MTDRPPTDLTFLAGGGAMGAAMRAHDWGATPLGGPDGWPQPLKTLAGIMLAADQPMFVAWGPELRLLYNDGYAPMLADRHPAALGQPFFGVWSEVERDLAPLVDRVRAGEPVHMDDMELQLDRPGRPRESHFAFSYMPVLGERGAVAGLFCTCTETSEQILADRSRRTAEAQLAESETRFRDMADNAPVMMWVTSPDGRCTYLNRRWYAFTGQPERAGEGLGWIDAVHPDDRAAAEAAFLAANAEHRDYRIEFRLRRADGAYRWAIDAAAARFDAGGAFMGYVGSVIDIDERREAELALRDSEARLQQTSARMAAALKLTGLGTFEWDLASDAVTLDERASAIFGFPPGETRTAAEVFARIDSDDLAGVQTAARDAQATLSPLAVDYRIVLSDGTRRHVASMCEPLVDAGTGAERMAGVFEDATPRVRNAAALRALNESLEAQVAQRSAERDRLWSLSQDMLARADYAGMMSAVSPAWSKVLGWSEAELLTRDYSSFMHPEDMPPTLAAIGRMAETGLPTRFENRIATREGGWKHIEWTVAPEPDNLNFIAVGRDITTAKERAAELEQTQEALRQAQKMEAVGQLTGGIAHDFNNLLTGVIGSLDMMQRRMAKGETDRVERYVTAAMTSANRAAALTHRLLAFSRRQPLDPRPVSANRLVSGMEELLRRTIGESVALEIVTAGGLWQTLCDPHQLESAILNLAINARDAMPDGGQLTIETCNAHLDTAYAAQSRDVRPGQYVCICVTDTGTGMDKDTVAKVFEPFFTTKPIGQGTGLGLSMIYGFARQSEGYARIYSEVGQGTTVKLYLPRYYGEAEDAEEAHAGLTEAHEAEDGEVVLVVEDETAVRDLVVDLLGELGYRAVEAADGPTGLKLIQSDMRVDLLVTDIGLPGLNGRQLADAARSARPDLRVLFMTGYAENATLANGFLEPGMEMITKPFAVEALATRIRDMLEAG